MEHFLELFVTVVLKVALPLIECSIKVIECCLKIIEVKKKSAAASTKKHQRSSVQRHRKRQLMTGAAFQQHLTPLVYAFPMEFQPFSFLSELIRYYSLGTRLKNKQEFIIKRLKSKHGTASRKE